jgi:hypothetical protein
MNKCDELKAAVKDFFDNYLNYQEESDSGNLFNPVEISCCRAMMVKPLNDLLDRIEKLANE